MFEDITLTLFWLATTYFVANVVLGVMDGLQATNLVLETKIKQHLNDIIHRVRVEKIEDTFYWYDADDNEFLAQGSTDQQIVDGLKSRYPNHIFYLPTNHIISEKTDWKPKATSFNLTAVDPKS